MLSRALFHTVLYVLINLFLVARADAGSFACKCGNGTACSVTCACSGAVSCGHDVCSSGCGACSQGGIEVVARSLAVALYRASYIVRRGDYSARGLVTDFEIILKEAAGKKFDDSDRQLGTDGRPYVILRSTRPPYEQTILFLEDFLARTDEFIKIVDQNAPTIVNTVQQQMKGADKFVIPK